MTQTVDRLIAPLARDAALFLDFDGTLAPIQDDPATVALRPHVAEAVVRVAAALDTALAVISGRDIRDLAGRVPSGLWRIGGHGLETCGPDAPTPAQADAPPPALAAALSAFVEAHQGVHLETKGPILAVHYRAAPSAGPAAIEAVQAAVAALAAPGGGGAAAPAGDYVVQPGKMVVEAKPKRANKGAALQAMMAQPPFVGRRPMMIGDDATDENAFSAALALEGRAVKVGDGETLAPERLAGPEEVWAWLEREAGR